MKVSELGYPFLWKGRKSFACRRQARFLILSYAPNIDLETYDGVKKDKP